MSEITKEEKDKRDALMRKGACFGLHALNLILLELDCNWPEDECIVPTLRRDLIFYGR